MALPYSLRLGGAAALVACWFLAAPSAHADTDVWPTLKQQIFGEQEIAAEDGAVSLEAPEVALDAAIVPITIRIPEAVGEVKSLRIVIDKNPNPLVATVSYGPAAGSGGERFLATRVRVDNFSFVRAILETADGRLHMASRYVPASGGCAAGSPKDPDTENADLGKMIVRVSAPPIDTAPLFQAQVMLKHPNANGMQVDINNGHFIPARFVKEMVVTRGGELVLKMESTFSISANPNFRFSFGRGKDNTLDVVMSDTENAVFEMRSEPGGS